MTGQSLSRMHRALLVVCVLAPATALGQAFSIRPMTQSGRFIEAPRCIQQQIREAERSLEKNEESDAVVRLGDLLQRDPQDLGDSDLAGQDFFLGIDTADAAAMPGVAAVVTAKDLPDIEPTSRQRLLLARDRARCLPGRDRRIPA